MLKYVLDNRDEYIKFLQNIVSFKSLPGEEKELAEFILNELQKLPIDEAFIDGAGNVVGIIYGEGKGPNILLNGHMDIVPEGNMDLWAPYHPYKGEIVDGKLYGRGIVDMKGGLGAAFYGFKAVAEYLNQSGKKLSGNLVFTAVVIEEPATMFGMKYFFEHTAKEKGLTFDFAYIPEPSDGKIVIGQRGKIELVVKTFGKCAHSSKPHLGINAYQLMNPVAEAIFTGEGFDLEPDPCLGRSCITVTNCILKPGGQLSTVPDECEIAVDRRYSTKLTEEDLLNEFEAIFEKCKERYPEFKGSVEPRYFEQTSWTGYTEKVKKWHPAWRVEEDNEFVVKTVEALKKVGQEPGTGYIEGGTDGSYTCGIAGVPTICYSIVEIALCHTEQENAPVEWLVNTFEGFVAILSELYGIDLAEFDK